MKIYIGADHRGYALAERLTEYLREKGDDVELVGQELHREGDDYVDFAKAVGERVSSSPDAMGIAVCGSGVGVDIAANKVKGVRSALGYDQNQVRSARNDDDVNVLSLGSDFVTEEKAQELVEAFLRTPFAKEEKFTRRIEKVHQLEQ